MILEPRNKEKAELGWENDIESRPSEADLDTPISSLSPTLVSLEVRVSKFAIGHSHPLLQTYKTCYSAELAQK